VRVHESRVVHNGGSENFSVCMHMPHAVGEPHCIVLLLLLTLATLLSFKPPHRLSSPQHPGIEQHIPCRGRDSVVTGFSGGLREPGRGPT